MKNGGRVLRVLAWIVGGLFVLTLVALVAVTLILRSPAMQAKILHSIEEPLAAAGLKTTIASLSIDLFGGVALDGLAVIVDKPPMAQGQLKLERLRLRYSFLPLLARRLEISELRVEGLDGQLRLQLPVTAEAAAEPPPDIKALLDLIRKPPLTLDRPELIIQGLRLDLDLTRGPLHVHSVLADAELRAALALSPGRLEASFDGHLPLQIDLSLTPPEGARVALKTGINLKFNPDFKLIAGDETVEWQLNWPSLDLALAQLDLVQTGPAAAQSLHVAWPAMHYEQTLNLVHKGPAPSTIEGLIWPLELNLSQDLNGDPLQLEQSAQAPQAASAANRRTATPSLKTIKREIKLQLDLKNKLAAALPTLAQLEAANWDLDTALQMSHLSVTENGRALVSSPKVKLELGGKGEKGEGRLSSDLRVMGLTTAFTKAPFSLEQNLQANIGLSTRSLHLELGQRLDKKELLFLRLDARDPSDRDLTSELKLQLRPTSALTRIHPAAAGLAQIGYPHLELSTSTRLEHSKPLRELKSTELEALTITNSLAITATQTELSDKTIARFRDLKLQAQTTWLQKELDASVELLVKDLKHAALLRPIDLKQDIKVKGSGGERLRGELSASTQIGSTPLLQLTAALQDLVGKAILTSQLDLKVDPSLKQELAALKALDDTGPIAIRSEQTVSIEHGAAKLQAVKNFDPQQLTIDAQLNQRISSLTHKNQRYELQQPLTIDTKVRLVKGRGELTTKILAPKLVARDQAAVSDLRLGVKANLSDIATQKLAEVKVVGQIAAVDLLGELGKKPELKGLLRRLQLILHASVSNREQLSIKNLYASLQHPLLQFRGSGDFQVSGRGNFDGKLEVKMPDQPIAGLKGKGRFILPLHLTAYDKQKLSLRAEPQFRAFSVELGDFSVRNMEGSLSVQEELAIDKAKRIGFLYLNTQNPFVRVDYNNVEPYVGESAYLSIESMRVKHIELGPLVANFDVRQNLIYLNDFKADLLGGSALGRLYFDLHPERLQLGFLGRFSNLQLELLKEPARRRQLEKAVLSGRMGSSFDIHQRLAAGRIDITAIGRQQLSSLLDVLDPEYKDSQIGLARRAIQVAYPKFVAISMNQGLMDLTIGLGGLVSKDIVIRSIPLTALINANLGTTLQRIETMIQAGES